MFIELTHVDNRDKINKIHVNPYNISDMFRNQEDSATLITSLYGRYRIVEETPEEILDLIKDMHKMEQMLEERNRST